MAARRYEAVDPERRLDRQALSVERGPTVVDRDDFGCRKMMGIM